MRNREDVIAWCKALKEKTAANGCTEAEVMASIDKLRALMDAYEITAEDVEIAKDEDAILRDASDPSDRHGIKWRLVFPVEQFCGITIFKRRKDEGGGLVFVGARSDCDLAEWLLCDHLAGFVHHALFEHLFGPLRLAPPSERRTAIRNFVQGCTARITERMATANQRSAEHRTSNGRELVIIQKQAITAKLKECGIHLRSSGSASSGNFDQDAYEAGKRAGDRATFGRPMEGKGAALRIGKV